ncbi:hypothetical protein NKG94_15600 [Micromonospora sp. M12]
MFPHPLGDGRIRIGGGDFGIASEMVDDEHGNTWRLLNLMDGTRTRPELTDAMAEHSPGITAVEVDDSVDALIGMGFVEDASVPRRPGCRPWNASGTDATWSSSPTSTSRR